MARAVTAVEKVGLSIAAVALLVAVVALARDFYGWSSEAPEVPGSSTTTAGPPGTQLPSRPTTDGAPTSGPATTVRPPPGPPDGPDNVPALPRAPEQAALPPGRGLDIDTVPTTVTAADNPRADVLKVSFSDLDPGPGVTLSDPTDARPGADDCRARLGVPGVPAFDPGRGQFICVRTTDGNLVLIQYQGIDDDARFTFGVSTPG